MDGLHYRWSESAGQYGTGTERGGGIERSERGAGAGGDELEDRLRVRRLGDDAEVFAVPGEDLFECAAIGRCLWRRDDWMQSKFLETD